MKKLLSMIALISGPLLFGCNSTENKTNDTLKNNDTIVSEEKSTALQTDSTTLPKNTANENTANLVKEKLTAMFQDDLSKKLIDEQSRKFKIFEYNINEDTKNEIFVGLSGSYFCGSGGCTVLLLSPDGELINRFTVVDYPIAIANTKTKGWKDLVFTSNGKEHLMKFNGKKYPSNPSMETVYSSDSKETLAKGLATADQSYSW
ncbi:hypothetical protein [Pedobacter nyackensis]|uniref:hypothetical protein n=1 Tax=Pedobacter nyackensis TaxID=475255 RepID=UPI002931059C|nr:hypothetical protein [Pedobacter nyackensis]